MITTPGKLYIKRFISGAVPTIADAVAFGLGGAAETLTDASLQYEVTRNNVALTSFDYVNNRWVVKTSVPNNFVGTIYEVGLYSKAASTIAGKFGSRAIVSFDSATEKWVNGAGNASTFTQGTSRLGSDWLTLSPATSGTDKAVLNGLIMDYSGNSAADQFNIAYNVGTNIASLKIRFKTDASNYYEFTISSPSAGYNISRLNKSAGVSTGTPNWANITILEVEAAATSAGAGSLSMEGIRLEDVDTNDPDYVMISRRVLATPFVIGIGKTEEIEYYLNVTI